MTSVIGLPVDRVDGRAKVTGAATYAAEFRPPGLTHACLVLSTIARGRIAAIDSTTAEAVPGVLAVLDHRNAPRLAYAPLPERPPVDPRSGEQLRVFQDDQVRFSGQPIAVVVADTLETARHAAGLVRVRYGADPNQRTRFDATDRRLPSEATQTAGRPADHARGDADGAMAHATTRTLTHIVQPREHHNAIEPHATIAMWEQDRLTLWDKTQWVGNDRTAIAHVFGIPDERVRVISPFVGGAFGSALRTWPHVTIAAMAARQVDRPVSLALSRRELFTAVGFRPHTEQAVALGADADGHLAAIIQTAQAQVSAYEEYAEATLTPPHLLYACPNVSTRYRLVELDTNSPGPMRAPGMATGLLATEVAMDELAVALDLDPLELRRRNHAARDLDQDRPWSSNALLACYEEGARRFGWADRPAAPRSLRHGRDLVGWGMATAVHASHRAPAEATAALFGNGSALIRTAASDMGPGTLTSLTQVAAETLRLPIELVRLEIGDTALPAAPVHGGSITMASVGTAVQAACAALRARLADLARGDVPTTSDPAGNGAAWTAADDGADLGGASLERGSLAGRYAEILRRRGLDRVEASASAGPGAEAKSHSSPAWGAVFAEVRVDPAFGTVRVSRLVGAYDGGVIVNPKLARSQAIGGMVGGIGMALLEQVEWDPRFGRVMNASLAEYLVPVMADIEHLEAVFVPSEDRIFNPLGVKGIAEIALCGVAPAIVNAVWHATGIRVRDLPILPERLLMAA